VFLGIDIATIRVIVQIAAFVTVLIGLLLTLRQLRMLRKSLDLTTRQLDLLKRTYVDQHDWNRRKAAQDAIASSVQQITEDSLLLDGALNIMDKTDPFTLEVALHRTVDGS
jgi:predicted tellurium resistance membrane protein TerC